MSEYWIGDNAGRVLGPVSFAAIAELVSAGRLQGTAHVSRNGRDWLPVEDAPEIASLFTTRASVDRESRDRQQAAQIMAELQQLRGRAMHEIFGIGPGSDISAYRSAFFKMVKKYFPDRTADGAHSSLRQANSEMFAFLSDLMGQIEQTASRARGYSPSAPASKAGLTRSVRPPSYALKEFGGWIRNPDQPVAAEVPVNHDNTDMFTHNKLVNLNNGGVFIRTTKLLPLGETVDLTLRFEAPQRNVRVMSRVVWQNEQESPMHPRGVGLRFLEISQEDQRFIAYYVKKSKVGDVR